MTGKNYPQGIKWTRPRKEVYEILKSSEEPLNAHEIYNRFLQNDEQEICAISTIYRILSAFEEKEIVIKSNLMGDDSALYSLKEEGHQHYAICVNCHKKIPLKECPLKQLSKVVENEEFEVTGHCVELYGYCKDCRRKMQ